jgi:hypothetical protein
MLWDGKSKGTLNNIENLIVMAKKTLVYLTPEKAFHKIASKQDLRELPGRCDPARVREAQRQIRDKIPLGSQLSVRPGQS